MAKSKIIKILYNIYVFLFVFTMINREFLLFGLDMRFIILPLGVILFIYSFFKKKTKVDYIDKNGRLLILFYLYVILSNISWLWNGLEIEKTKFINEMILIINIFVSILVFYKYKEYFNKKQTNIFVVISCLVLVLSMALVSVGFELKDILGSENVPYIYVASEEAPDHINIFGLGFRPAGYASDPNYATLLLVIGCISLLQLKLKKRYTIPLMVLLLVAIGFACSKTILVAGILGIIFIAIIKLLKITPKAMKVLNILFILGVITFNLVIPQITSIKNYMPSTLTTRFAMWNSAKELFTQSPIIGNGITSFRSYFAQEHWYVQCHSTYWQILSELGILGLAIFVKILYNLLNKQTQRKDNLGYFILFVYIIYAITCETIAMQFIVFMLYLIQMQEVKEKAKGKKALFMINTLSNGGAERVCLNMASELIKQNYKVDFILLGQNEENKDTYEIDKNITIYNLNINAKNKIKKLIKIFLATYKIDEIIEKNEESEQYSLITSHLPMSNVLTRFSSIRDRAIYVFHLTIAHYDRIGSKLLFKILLKFIYGNKKIVTVSEGLRQEAINDYKFKEKYLKTIYNPLDEVQIRENENEPVEMDEKYILQIGRFNEAKRQDRMVEIFYKGEFYKKYKLVFCGTGQLEEKVKEHIKQLGIEDRVVFAGWQSNIYKWLKNAEILVSPTDCEAFPMNLIEAFSCKTKVVASNCKFGPNEILLGKYADYLVEPDNIEDYILKINNALISYPNEENPVLKKCKAKNVIKEYIAFMKK